MREVERFVSAARPGQGAGFPLWKVCGYCLRPGRALRQPGREGGGRNRGWEEAAGARQPGRARSRRAGRPGVGVQERGRASPLPSGVTQCSPPVVSTEAFSHRRRSRAWGVAACPRALLEDAAAPALEPW